MKFMSGIVGGLIGSLIGGMGGALIWALISGFANFELGWIAWGIGFLVGVGSNIGSQNQGGLIHGALAVLVALVCLFAGKVGGAAISVNRYVAQNPAEFEVTQELVISYIADDVAEEMFEQGTELVWPEHMDDIDAVATSQVDYPPEVWTEAQRRWDGWDESQRQYYRDQAELNAGSMGLMAVFGTFATLSPWDLLWAGLCLVTAGRIAYAGTTEE